MHAHHHDDDMKCKQVIAIREPPVPFTAGATQDDRDEIKTWCCISQGTSKLTTEFEKNVYTPLECAKAKIKVDNAQCQIDCTEVKFMVE